jgi:hypothetical protein
MSSRNASVTTPMTSPSTHAVPLSASSASERDRDRLANQSMVDSIAEAEAELRNTKLSLALACEEREEAYALSQQFKKQLLAAVSQLSLIQQVILRSCKHLHAVNCSLLGCSVQMKLLCHTLLAILAVQQWSTTLVWCRLWTPRCCERACPAVWPSAAEIKLVDQPPMLSSLGIRLF